MQAEWFPEFGKLGNHPLLFGTVSPTNILIAVAIVLLLVTTPYCSGLSLLRYAISEVRLAGRQ